MKGLDVSRVVNVQVNLQPKAAARRNFGVLMLLGDSDVIDISERIRSYTGIDGVVSDFGTSAPEYAAATLYFGQSPTPKLLMIGRWASSATKGMLKGSILSEEEKKLSAWKAVSTGALKIAFDGGTAQEFSNIDLSQTSITNLNGVASAITAAISAKGSCAWDGERFVITSKTTGATSKVSYADTPSSGTDLAGMMHLTTALALAPVDGMTSETVLEAVATLMDKSGDWYGLHVAAGTAVSVDDNIAVAGLIEAASQSRLYGVTITDTKVLEGSVSDDLASQLKALNYKRTCTQYSSKSKYAMVSMFGRAFTVNFSASRSTITLKFKQEPGVTYEELSETQASVLKKKNCNVFVYYNNDTSIVQEGVMTNGAFFDEIHGLDWLQNTIQTRCWNALYQSRKLPQTDKGAEVLTACVSAACEEGINNGLIADQPLPWNADGFGQLENGDMIDGYYIYQESMADQAQDIREQRIAPAIQVAVKLAGAIHFVDVIVNVNR